MAQREHVLASLLELPRLPDPVARRRVFRQAIATLGRGSATTAPLALAGVDPIEFQRSIAVAMTDGWFDDLAFIAPSSGALALHQIVSALPIGSERRAIARLVLGHLHQGDAETFAALASRMALGSTKPLEGAGIRARVELCLALRGDTDPATDRLALAIAMRRELATEWIAGAATGSLPDRRMAGQILERAAREAARRSDAGDRHPLRLFEELAQPAHPTRSPLRRGDGIATAWESLLADRETLVWKHVAIARGLLAAAVPGFADRIHELLSPEWSPTEWRRGATSLVASIGVDRDHALDDALALLHGPLLRRDPGIAMAMVWGLTPVAETEPEAAEELLDALATLMPVPIAESVVELRQQVPGFGQRAADACAAALRASLTRPDADDGVTALARGLAAELESGQRSRVTAAIHAAVDAYATSGAPKALELATQALAIASERMTTLTSLAVTYEPGADAAAARQKAMLPLRDLGANLLESHTLGALLLLDRPPAAASSGVEALDDLHAKLAEWLLAPARRDATPEEVDVHATLHQRELRTLLHLIDSGHTDFDDDHDRRTAVRQRWVTVVASFTESLRRRPQSRLTRALLATIARALDALVRDGSAEPVDVLLFAAMQLGDPAHLGILAEASMHPEVTELLSAYLGFARTESPGPVAEQVRARIASFKSFLERFPGQTTLRTEALRTTCWTLLHGFEAVLDAGAFAALLPGTGDGSTGALASLEDAFLQLQQLTAGAERRCTDRVNRSRVVATRHGLAHAIEAAANQDHGGELKEALQGLTRLAEGTLPPPIAMLATLVLPMVAQLHAQRSAAAAPSPTSREVKLPDWIPSRRILGGFYVQRSLGGGNVGSVFVVTRADERRDKDASRFALKVPEYNATAARTMSEAEFLKLFREEAGALLAIPEHPNVASFVTFDAGAKPKPILVMELVEGVSCERILGTHSVTTPLALHVLDGMLAGLESMHAVGIAHLDVKPSNVILRGNNGDPVLVDFGLAGRKIRPGCATLCYGAPEIWDATPENAHELPAMAADVYALGCCAYELLTGKTLFEGPTDVAIITQHIQHDGLPPAVAALGPERSQLKAFLASCLRRDPHTRASVKQLREALPALRSELESAPWPCA